MALCTDTASSGTPLPTRLSWLGGRAPTEQQWSSLHQGHLGAPSQQMQKGRSRLDRWGLFVHKAKFSNHICVYTLGKLASVFHSQPGKSRQWLDCRGLGNTLRLSHKEDSVAVFQAGDIIRLKFDSPLKENCPTRGESCRFLLM